MLDDIVDKGIKALPGIAGILGTVLVIAFNINYKIRGLEEVLDSVITFDSIIIGLYGALYGVIASMSDSKVFKTLKREGVLEDFNNLLSCSLKSSFILLISSIFLQLMRHYPCEMTQLLFDLWVGVLFFFIVITYRSITILLKYIFVDYQSKSTCCEKSQEEKRKQRIEMERNMRSSQRKEQHDGL